MKIDSIIFDLDGTLWNSCSSILEIWNKTLSNNYSELNRVITIEEINGVMGLTSEKIVEKLLPNVDKELGMKIFDECAAAECDYLRINGGKLYDKVEAVLDELNKKYRLFIVSNCQCGYVEAFLEAHKLEKYFIDFENYERTGLPKGDNIKLVIERNNLQNPIYVGDTEGDYNATKECNIPFVYAKYGFGNVEDAELVIESFEALKNIVKK